MIPQPAIDHPARVRGMFDRIAHRYDRLNRIMTLGQDMAWRRSAVSMLGLAGGEHVLDLGAGTGDLALEIRRQDSTARVTAADFSPGMIAVGRRRQGAAALEWVVCDALRLPFAGRSFGGVVSGFLLRNVAELDRALSEQFRVLRPGGWAVSLDTGPPPAGRMRRLLTFYEQRLIPLLGRLLAGESEAYKYLPQSIAAFLSPETLASRFQAAGFADVSFAQRMFGTVALHRGRRPLR